MAKTNASTVQEHLDGLPDDRRLVVEAVRKAILKSLPKGYREAMTWGLSADGTNARPKSLIAARNRGISPTIQRSGTIGWFGERFGADSTGVALP
jgi:hypothetical protein